MKNYKQLLAILFLGTSILSSCGNSDEQNITLQPAELLTATKWQMADLDAEIVVSLFGFPLEAGNMTYDSLKECEKDDLFSFEAKGVFSYESNTLKCVDEEDADVGTWSLDSEGKILTMKSPQLFTDTALFTDIELAFTINSLSENKLVLETSQSEQITIQEGEYAGITVLATITILMDLKAVK